MAATPLGKPLKRLAQTRQHRTIRRDGPASAGRTAQALGALQDERPAAAAEGGVVGNLDPDLDGFGHLRCLAPSGLHNRVAPRDGFRRYNVGDIH
jgi:hypothetical protein